MMKYMSFQAKRVRIFAAVFIFFFLILTIQPWFSPLIPTIHESDSTIAPLIPLLNTNVTNEVQNEMEVSFIHADDGLLEPPPDDKFQDIFNREAQHDDTSQHPTAGLPLAPDLQRKVPDVASRSKSNLHFITPAPPENVHLSTAMNQTKTEIFSKDENPGLFAEGRENVEIPKLQHDAGLSVVQGPNIMPVFNASASVESTAIRNNNITSSVSIEPSNIANISSHDSTQPSILSNSTSIIPFRTNTTSPNATLNYNITSIFVNNATQNDSTISENTLKNNTSTVANITAPVPENPVIQNPAPANLHPPDIPPAVPAIPHVQAQEPIPLPQQPEPQPNPLPELEPQPEPHLAPNPQTQNPEPVVPPIPPLTNLTSSGLNITNTTVIFTSTSTSSTNRSSSSSSSSSSSVQQPLVNTTNTTTTSQITSITDAANAPLLVFGTTAKISQETYSRMKTIWSTWSRLPHTEVICVADDDYTQDVAKQNHFHVTNEFRAWKNHPIYKSVFLAAKALSTELHSPFYGFSNGDIMFTTDVYDTMKAIQEANFQKFLVVGTRWNVNMSADFQLSEGPNWESQVQALKLLGKEFGPDAQDYFFMSHSTINWDLIPDFVIGGPAFDNWLLHRCIRDPSIDTIDTSRTITAIHVNHGDLWASHNTEMKDVNYALGKGQWWLGFTHNTKWYTLRNPDTGKVEIHRRVRGTYIPKHIRNGR